MKPSPINDMTKVQARFEGNRFVLQEALGSGGMGTVYKAWDTLMGRDVAIKVIDPTRTSRKGVERFRIEAQVLTKISHDNLILVHSIGHTTDGAPFIVMEFAQGDSLQALIDQRGTLSEELTVEIARQICLGLQAVHDIGAVHRDLKPANIQVSFDGSVPRVKILDFGIAKIINNKPQAVTTTTSVVGSPAYMSPEHLSGGKIDARCDVYSLGCIIYCCLGGTPPFDGETSMDIAYKHLHVEPDFLPGCSKKLQQIALVCLRKNPRDRFQSAAELLSALNSKTYVAAKIMPALNQARISKVALPVAAVSILVLAIIFATYSMSVAYLETALTASFRSLKNSGIDNHTAMSVTKLEKDWERFGQLRKLVGSEKACGRFGEDMSWGCAIAAEYYSYSGNENHQLGARWWQRCLDLREATPGMTESEHGRACLGLATELLGMGREAEARPLFLQGLKSNYPNSYFPQMVGIAHISELYLKEKKMDKESEQVWKRYFALLRYGPKYPDQEQRMVACLQPLAYATFASGDTDESRRYLDQLFQGLERVSANPRTPGYGAIMGACDDIALICASNAVKTAEQGKTALAESDLAGLKKRLYGLPLTPKYRIFVKAEIDRAERQIRSNRSVKVRLVTPAHVVPTAGTTGDASR